MCLSTPVPTMVSKILTASSVSAVSRPCPTEPLLVRLADILAAETAVSPRYKSKSRPPKASTPTISLFVRPRERARKAGCTWHISSNFTPTTIFHMVDQTFIVAARTQCNYSRPKSLFVIGYRTKNTALFDLACAEMFRVCLYCALSMHDGLRWMSSLSVLSNTHIA